MPSWWRPFCKINGAPQFLSRPIKLFSFKAPVNVIIQDGFLFFQLFTWSHPYLSEAHSGLRQYCTGSFISLNSCALASFPVWLHVGSTVRCVKYETVTEGDQLAVRGVNSERGGTWVGILLIVVSSLEVTFWFDDLCFATKPFSCRNRDHEASTPQYVSSFHQLYLTGLLHWKT